MVEETPKEIRYWQPRVMRHRTGAGTEYAIHEVYFSDDNMVVTYTLDALSPRASSIDELKRMLLSFVTQIENGIDLGDLGYTYDKDAILFWLEYIDEDPIDYDE